MVNIICMTSGIVLKHTLLPDEKGDNSLGLDFLDTCRLIKMLPLWIIMEVEKSDSYISVYITAVHWIKF